MTRNAFFHRLYKEGVLRLVPPSEETARHRLITQDPAQETEPVKGPDCLPRHFERARFCKNRAGFQHFPEIFRRREGAKYSHVWSAENLENDQSYQRLCAGKITLLKSPRIRVPGEDRDGGIPQNGGIGSGGLSFSVIYRRRKRFTAGFLLNFGGVLHQ